MFDNVWAEGCVAHIQGKLAGKVKPPFPNCAAVSGICGPTCGSGVYEPSFWDPSASGYHQLKNMHCVAPDARVLDQLRLLQLHS